MTSQWESPKEMAFLRDLADSHEPWKVLVYADKLDDDGDPDCIAHAAFLRHEVGMADRPEEVYPRDVRKELLNACRHRWVRTGVVVERTMLRPHDFPPAVIPYDADVGDYCLMTLDGVPWRLDITARCPITKATMLASVTPANLATVRVVNILYEGERLRAKDFMAPLDVLRDYATAVVRVRLFGAIPPWTTIAKHALADRTVRDVIYHLFGSHADKIGGSYAVQSNTSWCNGRRELGTPFSMHDTEMRDALPGLLDRAEKAKEANRRHWRSQD